MNRRLGKKSFGVTFSRVQIGMAAVLLFSLAITVGRTVPTAAQEKSPFTLRPVDEETVALFDGDSPVWCYVYRQKTNEAVPTADPRRVAASYFHPVYGLGGETLTASATLDDNHAHHHGIWSSFTTVILHRAAGTEENYDTWTDNTRLKKNFIRWKNAENQTSDGHSDSADASFLPEANSATLAVENGWFLDGKEKIMDETLTVVTGRVESDPNAPELGRWRTIEFSWSWKPVREKITLAGDRATSKNFSSLAIRFARPNAKPLIRSDSGEVADDVMVGNFPWLDYESTFGDQNAFQGIAIFPNPNNPKGSGAGMAVRHYGLLATGWPGLGGITLSPDEPPVTVSYRVLLHEKPWNVERLRKIASLCPPFSNDKKENDKEEEKTP